MRGRAIATVRAIVLAFGWRGILRRLVYIVLLRTGWLRRRLPMASDFDEFEAQTWEHRLGAPDLAACDDDVVVRAQALLDGTLRFYGWSDRQVGWPPCWHRNVFSGHDYPLRHWTEISDADATIGDIKDVWELSRFTWVFLLARAWARTEDDRWPEAFWVALESWMHDNPPNTGVNWRCAQESSLRGIAVQFGLSVFGAHHSATPQRRRSAGRLLEATRQRVRPTVGYALSQRNNHAISELCFLLTLDPSDRRLNRLLRECLSDQFYADGSYSQQSPTYQRLAIHTLLWLATVTTLPSRTEAAMNQALDRSAVFLARIIDPVSRHAPNYGPNDGALLLDLDAAPRADFAPTLDLLGLGDGSTESAAWLPRRPTPDPMCASSDSTYVTLTAGATHVLMRCGTGRHRPAHDDQLAVDVWMDGMNVVPDPGTYRYTAAPPWGNALTTATVHARPHVEGSGHIQLGRFLSAPGLEAEARLHRTVDGIQTMTARLPGRGGALHRTVAVDGTGVTIIDEVEGGQAHARITHPPAQRPRLEVDAPKVRTRDASETDPTSGWFSPHYAQRLPCGATDYRLVPGRDVRVTVGAPSEDRAALARRRHDELVQRSAADES